MAEGEGLFVGAIDTCGRGDADGLGNKGVFSGGMTVDGVGEGVGLGDTVLGGDGITRGGGGAPPPPPNNTTPPPPPPPPPLGADVGPDVTSIGDVGCAEGVGDAVGCASTLSALKIVTSSDATDVAPEALTALIAETRKIAADPCSKSSNSIDEAVLDAEMLFPLLLSEIR